MSKINQIIRHILTNIFTSTGSITSKEIQIIENIIDTTEQIINKNNEEILRIEIEIKRLEVLKSRINNLTDFMNLNSYEDLIRKSYLK